jgi:hypothetical protein
MTTQQLLRETGGAAVPPRLPSPDHEAVMNDTVLLSTEGAVATLTLDRPKVFGQH